MKNFVKKAQNLVEFVIVIPILVLVIFGIIEISVLWKTYYNVQSIATQAAVVSAGQFVSASEISNTVGTQNFNKAVAKAIDVTRNRLSSLGINTINFSSTSLGSQFGEKPYALYEIVSDQIKNTDRGTVPLIKLTVDYRDPFNKGVITQLTYNYRTILLGAEFFLPSGKKVVIIPKDIEVSSTKVQEYVNY